MKCGIPIASFFVEGEGARVSADEDVWCRLLENVPEHPAQLGEGGELWRRARRPCPFIRLFAYIEET